MRVRALRGVCIGVGRHLSVGDVEDLDHNLVTYLSQIGAVERLPDPPPVVESIPKSKPEKSGKEK